MLALEEEPGAVSPVIRRYFDAVEIANGNWTYYLNRKRLETAIALIELYYELHHLGKIARLFREEYPDLTPQQVQNYIVAAYACLKYKVTP